MQYKNLYKTISYLEESKEDCIFYPSSLFWTDTITERDILDNWKNLVASGRANVKNNRYGVGLYIHYPFCTSKCSYCFLDTVVYEKKYENYLTLLELEVKKIAPIFQGIKIKNLYIGGGTISLLQTAQIDALFCILEKYFDLSNIEQVTAEVSPLTTTNDKIQCFKNHGLDRLVLGVQSLDATVLKANNRYQNTKRISDIISFAHDIGIKNIKIDLIAGLPGDTYESFSNTLKLVKEQFQINELAIYPFVPHENTDFVLSGGIYNQEDIALRKKMMVLARRFQKQYSQQNSLSYNHQIIEEEQNGLSILGLGYMAISKIFGRGVYKKESFSDYEKWLLSSENVNFTGINYTIDDECTAYLTRNLRKFYEADFHEIFGFPIQKYSQYQKLERLFQTGFLVSGEDAQGKYIKLKEENFLMMIVLSKYLYSEELIQGLISSNRYSEYPDVDFRLKQIFEEY